MIPQSSGKELRQQAKEAAKLDKELVSGIKFDVKVQSLWSQLRKLKTKEAWPADPKKRHKTYRKLSLKYHPDKSQGSDDRYEAVKVGYRAANYFYSEDLMSKFDFDTYMDLAE